MIAEIIATNPTPDTETFPFAFSYTHIGCSAGTMSLKREDPINDICTISCKCGLRISFKKNGEAYSTIMDVSIDREPRNLPEGSFTVSSPIQSVRIHSGERVG